MLLETLRAQRLVVPDTLGAETLGHASRHSHDWQLRSVEFENGVEVSQFDCGGCAEVLFR